MNGNGQEPIPESNAPRGKTILMVSVLIVVLLFMTGVWLAYRMNVAPQNECAYRGGVWSFETESCVYEGGMKGGSHEQSGQKLPSIILAVPDGEGEVTFSDVEVGGTGKEYAAEFDMPDAPTKGTVMLMPELSRVQKESGDLVMPFAVNYGGTGAFNYLGIFKAEGASYRLQSSRLVGDRIGVDSLSLSSRKDDAYTARLLYRDHAENSALASTPTDPRALEVTVFDHMIEQAFITSREGLLYKDILKLSSPKLREAVTSPLSIEGEARGTWFFEASFPVTLVDWDGKIIAEGVAQAEGEWMTEEFVPFSATLTYTLPADLAYPRGTLILKKENPSGLAEHEDAFEIPVVFR